MQVRDMSAGDVGAVARLCAQELVHDREAGALPAILARRPCVGLVATRDAGIAGDFGTAGADLAGACIGSVARHGDGSSEGFVDLLAVRREEQRRGIGRRLLAELERRLAAAGCERISIAGHGPYYAWPGIDLRYSAAVCFAEDLGYRRQGCEVNMDVDLLRVSLDTVTAQERLRTEGIEVRRAGAADDGPLQASLADVWRADWVAEVVAALRSSQAGLQLALQQRRYVGFCAHGLNRAHEVGPVGTDPGLRGLGLGTVLLKRCLAEQRDRGLDRAELVWAGPLSYFSTALGATIGRAFWQYEKDLTGRDTRSDWRNRIGLI